MKKLFNIQITDAEFDYLICQQNKGKELVVVDGEILAVDHIITEEEILNSLRHKREQECFPIINRGQLWYNKLTPEQIEELDQWYCDWLNVTETKVEPSKPEWLN